MGCSSMDKEEEETRKAIRHYTVVKGLELPQKMKRAAGRPRIQRIRCALEPGAKRVRCKRCQGFGHFEKTCRLAESQHVGDEGTGGTPRKRKRTEEASSSQAGKKKKTAAKKKTPKKTKTPQKKKDARAAAKPPARVVRNLSSWLSS
ncbi:uncharacterized protein LOC102711392 isoform X2 [Oryza brachyantha]|uniref:uncharacterized protein LOC102711392 isoform X2 n=1 Tax=Oryza brachyantha TaxID=4533 RepID=UPI001ADC33B6|nr:uncharacterized protein LOC102711392 isoform X2 [Oryza brachyantha]